MKLRPLVWLTLYTAGICIAAEATAPTPAPRTLESLPALVWWFAVGYSFAGWVMANLKNAVIAMNGEENKFVAVSGVLSTLVASHLVGISLCLYMLTEVQMSGKPVPALLAYFAAAIGSFGGMRLMELGLEVLKGFALKWASRGNGSKA